MCCRQAGNGGRDGRNIRRSPMEHFVVSLYLSFCGSKKRKKKASQSTMWKRRLLLPSGLHYFLNVLLTAFRKKKSWRELVSFLSLNVLIKWGREGKGGFQELSFPFFGSSSNEVKGMMGGEPSLHLPLALSCSCSSSSSSSADSEVLSVDPELNGK